MSQEKNQFWVSTPLEEMSKEQWESLCDGCGKCCLLKLEDEDDGTIEYTNIACRLFDDKTCTCTNYPLRKQLVAGCVVLGPENISRNAYWMPSTCAYRLLYEGKTLPSWHPLITGDRNSVHEADISMQGKTLAEHEVSEDELENYVIEGLQ